jgi:hypothetical protein
MVALWLAAFMTYWWPRRRARLALGLSAVGFFVVLALVLGTASLVPCRNGLATNPLLWVLELFIGQQAPVYQGGLPQPGTVCTGTPPVALQFAQIFGVAATLTGLVTAGAGVWRPPLDFLRSRLTPNVVIFTGLDPLTLPLLGRLMDDWEPVVVIEPDPAHPLLEQARQTRARIIIGNPWAQGVLEPLVVNWRGPKLSRLYALRGEEENEAVLATVRSVLDRYGGSLLSGSRLIVRIDDPLNAAYWRASRTQPGDLVIEDAISVAECTARTLADHLAAIQLRRVLICGGGSLTLALLLELARQSWEQAQLAAAAAGMQPPAEERESMAPPAQAPVSASPVLRLTLLDPGAGDTRRDYLRTAPPAFTEGPRKIDAEPGRWQEHLLPALDAVPGEEAGQTAVVVTDRISVPELHEIERITRLHPQAAVFTQLPTAGSSAAARFYGLHVFTPGFLVDGEVPEDSWTRIARHWHQCRRMMYAGPPGAPLDPTRESWDLLSWFFREDTLLRLRLIMSETAGTGRLWIPAQMVPPGSIIELGEQEAGKICEAEHGRWLSRQLAYGGKDELLVPWASLPPSEKAVAITQLRTQVAQLEDIGLVPIVPIGGPPEAITVERRQFICDGSSGENTQEIKTLRAWQATGKTAIRTVLGRATAEAGDWIIEAASGSRWPVTDHQFQQSYQPRS